MNDYQNILDTFAFDVQPPEVAVKVSDDGYALIWQRELVSKFARLQRGRIPDHISMYTWPARKRRDSDETVYNSGGTSVELPGEMPSMLRQAATPADENGYSLEHLPENCDGSPLEPEMCSA